MSKRAENEKKTITKSMKLSPDAVQYIEGEAEKLNMNFSQYMLDCVMHRECSITPEILCRLENIIEMCMSYIDNDKDSRKIRREVNKLWECLK